MGATLLGFALVQVIAFAVARGGGVWRLRGAFAALGDVAGASEAVCFGRLGAPHWLRHAQDADDVFDEIPEVIADWAERGPHGGWHVALAFVGDRCLGVAACNFQPVAAR